ncbi:conserved hypothetical protein [Haemophilus influenzae NT127]|nr:conserved hypothetical protein [Haemophilus influenzae NT127]
MFGITFPVFIAFFSLIPILAQSPIFAIIRAS